MPHNFRATPHKPANHVGRSFRGCLKTCICQPNSCFADDVAVHIGVGVGIGVEKDQFLLAVTLIKADSYTTPTPNHAGF